MALVLEKTINGVTGEYWKVISCKMRAQETKQFYCVIAMYENEEARRSVNTEPLITLKYTLDAVLTYLEEGESMYTPPPMDEIYEQFKEHPYFDGAIDA